jgi:hypothetical protein
LKALYGNVDNIDVWIGILAEDHLPGTSLGKTMHEILRIQFEKLRDGDYYFYLNDPFLPLKTKNKIINTKFSDLLKRNTKLTNIQANVFFTEECPGTEGQRTIPDSPDVHSLKVAETQAGIFPNPAFRELNVVLADADSPATIKIFSTQGVLVKTINVSAHQNNVTIDVSSFRNAVYLVSIDNGNTVKTFKFIKLAE